jgi:hypothetical protein
MSLLVAAPQLLADAASDLAGLGSTISTANAAASPPTTGLLPAAADEVSTQIAALFSTHGQGFQRLSAQAAAFHEQFVRALTAGANTYATAEANAVQTLRNAVNAPARAVLGHPLMGSGANAGGKAGGVVSNAVGRVESVLQGNSGAAGLFGGGSNLLSSAGAAARQGAGALALAPTGGIKALTAASALLQPGGLTNAAVAPAAFGDTIKNTYNFVEPYVRYGFELVQYAVGYVPWIGFLAPQVLFFYDLFEPMVQSGLFNILDWLGGSITFVQGLNNFLGATTASINQFINTEINWALSFLPPLPPLPPFP